MSDSRGASAVVSNLLLIAVVVVLASVVSVFALGVSEDVRNPGPAVSESSGEFTAQDGRDGGTVRIVHVAGESLSVEDIEVAIDATAACGERERLINLPEKGTSGRYADENVASGSIDSSIVDGGFGADLGVFDSRTSDTFDAGSYFEFRLTGEACPLSQGDQLTVRVVHTPTETVTIEKTLTA